MGKKLKTWVVLFQNFIIIFVVLFFLWDSTTQDYTSFTFSPPNTSDKIWYLGEALLFFVNSIMFVLFNAALIECFEFGKYYKQVWISISIYLLTRFLWIIIWITWGLSANDKRWQTVSIYLLLSSISFITFLPYLKKIIKGIK